MPKGSSRSRDLILGLLFFGGLFALVLITTQLRNWPGIGTRQYMSVLFEDVYGVRKEDAVRVHGTTFGRVAGVFPIDRATWDATGRDLVAEGLAPGGRPYQPNVLLVIELDHPVQIRRGYGVYAEDANLLGGKIVTIDPGKPSDPEQPAGPLDSILSAASSEDLRKVVLVGQVKPHPITALGRLVEDNLDSVNQIVENVRVGSEGLDDKNKKGMLGYLLTNEDARSKAENVVKALDELATASRQENSLVHDLFHDSKLRKDLSDSLANVSDLSSKAKDPNSILGGLVTADSPLDKSVDSAVARIDSAAAKAESFLDQAKDPNSILGGLVTTDSELDRSVDSVVRNIDDMVASAKTNEGGLIYQAIYGDLGSRARSMITNIDDGVSQIRNGVLRDLDEKTGALGYIISDPESKKKLDRLISATLGIIEDAREAAPVTSLGSFIFGGF